MKPSVYHSGPWRTGLLWAALALGVWFLWAGLGPAVAVESDSALFQQPVSTAGAAAPGAPSLPLPEEKPQPAPGWGATLLRLVSALVLTLVLLVGTVWVLKLLWEKRGWEGGETTERPVKILSTTFLAPRKSVHLVEVGQRILVVGSGHEELCLLDVITDAADIEKIRESSRTNAGAFPDVFKKVWSRQETGANHEEARRLAEESRQAIGGFVDKVKNLSPRTKSGPKTGGGDS